MLTSKSPLHDYAGTARKKNIQQASADSANQKYHTARKHGQLDTLLVMLALDRFLGNGSTTYIMDFKYLKPTSNTFLQ